MLDQLQSTIAQTFPDEYHPDDWQELLPRFITQQLGEMRQEGEELKKQASLETQDEAPQTIVLPFPPLLAYACELQLQRMNLTPMAVACSLLVANERADYYEDQWRQCRKLFDEFSEASLELVQDYKDLKNGTRLGNWLN